MTSLRTRLLGVAAGGLALSLLFTGCGGGKSGSDGANAADNSVIVVIDGEPESLNPGLTTSISTLEVQPKVYEGLIWLDKDGKAQPQLASSWTISSDELTYTFKLRDGVKWHDGKDFSSADVKWSFETGLKGNARAQGAIKQIQSIATPDAKTVVFTLAKPYAPFLQMMKVYDTPILSQAVYGTGDMKTNPANRAPVGTGPFKFKSWDAGQKIVLEKNPNYWVQGEPKLNEVIFQIIPEAQNRVNAITSGEVDVLPAAALPQANFKQIEGGKNLNVNKTTAIPAVYFMMFNTTNPALTVEARQAIAQAVDRQRVVDQAMGGLGTPGYGAWGSGFKWANNPDSSYDKLYKFDSAAAKAKLATTPAAGKTFRLTYDANRAPFVAGAQIIKDNLAQVGITVTLEPLEKSVYSDKVFVKKDFDLALQSYTSSSDPAIGYHRLYITNTSNALNTNPTGFSDPTVDNLLAQAGGVSDLAKRGEYYRKAQAILDVQLPTLILFDELQADVNNTRVAGMYEGMNPTDQYGKVYIKK